MSFPIESTQHPAATDTNCNKSHEITVIVAMHFPLNSVCHVLQHGCRTFSSGSKTGCPQRS